MLGVVAVPRLRHDIVRATVGAGVDVRRSQRVMLPQTFIKRRLLHGFPVVAVTMEVTLLMFPRSLIEYSFTDSLAAVRVGDVRLVLLVVHAVVGNVLNTSDRFVFRVNRCLFRFLMLFRLLDLLCGNWLLILLRRVLFLLFVLILLLSMLLLFLRMLLLFLMSFLLVDLFLFLLMLCLFLLLGVKLLLVRRLLFFAESGFVRLVKFLRRLLGLGENKVMLIMHSLACWKICIEGTVYLMLMEGLWVHVVAIIVLVAQLSVQDMATVVVCLILGLILSVVHVRGQVM